MSAGWWTDQAAITTPADRELTVEEVDRAMAPPYRVTALERQSGGAR